jgi:hypothetical protein
MRLPVTLRSATRTALICEPMITSASSKAITSAARRVTSSIGPPASHTHNSTSRPRMPPRLLISDTASFTLLVEAGPQIPGEPEKVTKLATRTLLRAPLRREKSASNGRSDAFAATADRSFSVKGGME